MIRRSRKTADLVKIAESIDACSSSKWRVELVHQNDIQRAMSSTCYLSEQSSEFEESAWRNDWKLVYNWPSTYPSVCAGSEVNGLQRIQMPASIAIHPDAVPEKSGCLVIVPYFDDVDRLFGQRD